jgi:hypothetical protein
LAGESAVSGGRRSATPVVSRAYRPEFDVCLRALVVLLKKPVKEGGPAAAPKDDVKESNGYVAYSKHNR